MPECNKCGDCCRNLNLADDRYIDSPTGIIVEVTNGVCEFLTEENLCSLHPDKPKFCSDYFCDECEE